VTITAGETRRSLHNCRLHVAISTTLLSLQGNKHQQEKSRPVLRALLGICSREEREVVYKINLHALHGIKVHPALNALFTNIAAGIEEESEQSIKDKQSLPQT
jgi:hypothetical protein